MGENKSEAGEQIEQISEGPKWGIRHLQIALLFIAVCAGVSMRTSLNTAVLSMTANSTRTDVELFTWDKEIHGYIFSSGSWGSIVVQAVAGTLINRYGSKIFLTLSTGMSALTTILTPLAASIWDWKGVCVVMSFQGLWLAFIFPCIHTMLGKWAPVTERTRLGMYVYTGMNVGFVVSPPIAGFIGTSSLGWPSIFYFFGGFSMIACILYYVYGSNSPAECKRITKEERKFIEDSLEVVDPNKKINVPWKAMFTSKPVIALFLSQLGGTYGFTVMYNEASAFFNMALGIELQESGLYVALGYVNAVWFTLLASWISDYCLRKNYLSITNVRKMCNTVGCWLPGFCFLSLVVIPTGNVSMMVTAVILMAGFDGINNCGYLINHIDLTPRFAGLLLGVMCAIIEAISLTAPIITGHILGDDTANIAKWRYVFIIAASTYLAGNAVFLIWGTGEKQPWDDVDSDENKKNEKDMSVELLERKTEVLKN